MTELEKRALLAALDRAFYELTWIYNNLMANDFDEHIRTDVTLDVIETRSFVNIAREILKEDEDDEG